MNQIHDNHSILFGNSCLAEPYNETKTSCFQIHSVNDNGECGIYGPLHPLMYAYHKQIHHLTLQQPLFGISKHLFSSVVGGVPIGFEIGKFPTPSPTELKHCLCMEPL